jgi:hypothetical protein
VKISRKDQNNIQANTAYVYGESLYGAEYGRIPLDEVDAFFFRSS